MKGAQKAPVQGQLYELDDSAIQIANRFYPAWKKPPLESLHHHPPPQSPRELHHPKPALSRGSIPGTLPQPSAIPATLGTWSPPLRGAVNWQPFSGQPAAHSVAPCFCQFLRAGGYMLTLPESRPPGHDQRATEEHWTPGSERPGVESLGCGNLPWTHTLGWGKGFACLHSSIPTQHLELQLAGTWKISLSTLLFSRSSSMKSWFSVHVVGQERQAQCSQPRLITSSHPAPGESIIVPIWQMKTLRLRNSPHRAMGSDSEALAVSTTPCHP